MKNDAVIAEILLERGATTLQPDEPFRYTSGIVSPIYNDLRVLLSYPDDRKKISKLLEKQARENFKGIDAIAGTATAGIPWAAWLAAAMNVPMVYVRQRAKRHGQKNQIEGVLKPGSKTLIIEDLVSTGQSALGSVHAIRRAGSEPLGVVGIFTYQMEEAVKAFKKAQTPLYTLTNFRTLVSVAERKGQLSSDSRDKVLEWASDPAGWGKKMGLK
ncbi:orotate phosphoribosyltransferase [Patescibacteria group bacterium]|nr:orotate phosphoribosyltransferase [Patescibacteria group bacterium]